MEKTLNDNKIEILQQENKPTYMSTKAKRSYSNFLAYFCDGEVDISLPFFGLDVVRASTHFDVDFPQWIRERIEFWCWPKWDRLNSPLYLFKETGVKKLIHTPSECCTPSTLLSFGMTDTLCNKSSY
jgi:hypothetical protein